MALDVLPRVVALTDQHLRDRSPPIQRHEPVNLVGGSAETGAGQEVTGLIVSQEHALHSEPCICRYSRQRPLVPMVDRYFDMYSPP